MAEEEIILIPKIKFNNSFLQKGEVFICSCCTIPYEGTSLNNKKNKCSFCCFNNLSYKNTIAFTFKQFLFKQSFNKTILFGEFIKLNIKYKFLLINYDNFIFFLNFKNLKISNNSLANYLNLFFEEVYSLLNINKIFNIKKDFFCNTYVNSIIYFNENKKRPFGKRVLVPFFNCKMLLNFNKREVLNKNIFV